MSEGHAVAGSARHTAEFDQTATRRASETSAATSGHPTARPRCLSVFSGAGGLDLGLEQAGFDCVGCIEIDADARATLAANRPGWRLVDPGDVLAWTPESLLVELSLRPGELELLASGPPCQPFSKAGWWGRDAGRLSDPRARTWQALLNLIEHALPEALLIENVPGIAYAGNDDGFQLVRTRLRAINSRHGTRYDPVCLKVNAADYGVPQRRERMFVIADRDGRRVGLPEPTHGSRSVRNHPATTAWHALGHVPKPSAHTLRHLKLSGKWADLLPSIPAGRNYLWHTERGGGEPIFGWRTRYWSFLLKLTPDQPAWTIQSSPGPATGPFHWDNRHLSREERAALQCFPAGYDIAGSHRAALRQLGNAVPCALGELVGLEIRRQLHGKQVRRSLRLLPGHPGSPPTPPDPLPLADRYLDLVGTYAPHPGPGEGPGAEGRKQRTDAFFERHGDAGKSTESSGAPPFLVSVR